MQTVKKLLFRLTLLSPRGFNSDILIGGVVLKDRISGFIVGTFTVSIVLVAVSFLGAQEYMTYDIYDPLAFREILFRKAGSCTSGNCVKGYGTRTWKKGVTIKAITDKKDSEESYSIKESMVYTGTFLNGYPHGHGTLTIRQGKSLVELEGTFVHGKTIGDAVERSFTLTGKTSKRLISTKEVNFILKPGNSKPYIPHGQGRLLLAGGTYTGLFDPYFIRGTFEGNNKKLVGDFKNLKLTKGKYYREGSLLYDGSYDDQGRITKGRIYKPGNEKSYREGTFDRDGKLHGKGVVVEDGRERYSGPFKHGKKHGFIYLADETTHKLYIDDHIHPVNEIFIEAPGEWTASFNTFSRQFIFGSREKGWQVPAGKDIVVTMDNMVSSVTKHVFSSKKNIHLTFKTVPLTVKAEDTSVKVTVGKKKIVIPQTKEVFCHSKVQILMENREGKKSTRTVYMGCSKRTVAVKLPGHVPYRGKYPFSFAIFSLDAGGFAYNFTTFGAFVNVRIMDMRIHVAGSPFAFIVVPVEGKFYSELYPMPSNSELFYFGNGTVVSAAAVGIGISGIFTPEPKTITPDMIRLDFDILFHGLTWHLDGNLPAERRDILGGLGIFVLEARFKAYFSKYFNVNVSYLLNINSSTLALNHMIQTGIGISL
jgi:hypothetical protein